MKTAITTFLRRFKMNLKAQKIDNRNQALSELSQMLHLQGKGSVDQNELIDVSRLDFSVDSLNHIDEYLESIRLSKSLDKKWRETVLRTGAYVGEVIRLSSEKEWNWIDSKSANILDPNFFESLQGSIGFSAVLYDGTDGFWFPLAKVEKRLQNGAEDSVLFFAQTALAT